MKGYQHLRKKKNLQNELRRSYQRGKRKSRRVECYRKRSERLRRCLPKSNAARGQLGKGPRSGRCN